MTKATFFPMLVLAGIYFSVKGIKYALWGFGVTVVIFLLLLRDEIFSLAYWFAGLAFTTGRNPSDVSSLSLTDKILSAPGTAIEAVPLTLLALLVFIGLVIWWKRSRGTIQRTTFLAAEYRLILLAMVALILTVFLTIKDYRQGDLLNLAILAPFIIAAGAQFFEVGLRGKASKGIAWVVIGAGLILASYSFVDNQRLIAEVPLSPEYLAEIEYLENARENGSYVAYAYGVFTQGTALGFGDDLSHRQLAGEIDRQYPRQWALSFETMGLEYRTITGLSPLPCANLSAALESNETVLIAPGRTIDLDALRQANKITELELVQTFGEWPVYSVKSVSCTNP